MIFVYAASKAYNCSACVLIPVRSGKSGKCRNDHASCSIRPMRRNVTGIPPDGRAGAGIKMRGVIIADRERVIAAGTATAAAPVMKSSIAGRYVQRLFMMVFVMALL